MDSWCDDVLICLTLTDIWYLYLLVIWRAPQIFEWSLFVSHIDIRLHLSLEKMNKDSECVRTTCWRDTQTEKRKKKKSYWWEKITQSGNSSGLEKIMSYGVLLFILSTIPVKIIKLRTLKSVQIHAVHTLTNSNVPGHSL